MASVIGVGPWSTGEDRKKPGKSDSRRRGARSDSARDQHVGPDIIPQLLVAHSAPPVSMPVGAAAVTPDEIANFATLAVRLEAHDLLAEVEAIMRRGLGVERIFVELLAPSARLLGEDWTADRLDFLDVTMALWRLQEVLREIGARTPTDIRQGSIRSALFSPFPGDQHGFGAAMIEETFARAGWDTELLLEPTRTRLLSRVADTCYDLVGLTVTCDYHIAPLPSLIIAVRNVSKNPNIRLMLGGRLLIEDPALAGRVGADGTAATAIDALETADRLLSTQLTAITA